MSDLPKTTKIHDLPKVSEVNDSDIFIIQSDENTNKIDGADLKAVMQQQAVEATFEHTSDNEIHVTKEEKELWNGMSGGGSDFFVTKEELEEAMAYENESVADVTNVKEALDVIFEGGIDVDISALTTNLLPIPQTSENNGITCTNNGDGSLTFNGETSENSAWFYIPNHSTLTLKKGKYKIMLNPSSESGMSLIIGGASSTAGIEGMSITDSSVIEVASDGTIGNGAFKIPANTVIDNITVKPMITTNLDATLDDFVPYTGNTGKLNGDVAEIRRECPPIKVVDTEPTEGATSPYPNGTITFVKG